MRIVFTVIIVFFTTIYLKAQHNVIEPSALKTGSLATEIPNWEESVILDHKVVKLGSNTQSLPAEEGFDYSQLSTENYRDLGVRSKKAPATPSILQSFEANRFNGFTPADNTMAVSDGGIIVSSINSNVYVYQDDGQVLSFKTFESFKRQFFPLLDGDWFDPRVVYDQDADRFILIILHGHTPTETRVLVFFSKTNNPVDGWYPYEIDGDITERNYWFDYPNIAVNKNSVFVSGNMFNSSNNFEESAILNIDKSQGYAGSSTLDYTVWDGLVTSLDNAFTVVPVQKGTRGSLSEGAYFMATDGGNGSYVMLYSLNTSNNSLNSASFTIDQYARPQDSPQKDFSDDVDMGDTRMKSAIQIDNSLHFVFSTSTIQGNAAVAYYRYDIPSKKVSSAIFHKQGKGRYMGFPTVCAAGTSYDDHTVFIAYAECGASIYPEMRIMSVDADMEASDVLLIEGEGYVDILSDNIERWGDYFTIANKFNSNTAWAFGCIGNSSEDFDNYLFEVSLDTEASRGELSAKPKSAIALYPNPASEYIKVNFELNSREVVDISLYDQQGKLIQTLTKDAYNPGTHQLQLNIAPLAKGTYFVRVSGSEGLLADEQVLKK